MMVGKVPVDGARDVLTQRRTVRMFSSTWDLAFGSASGGEQIGTNDTQNTALTGKRINVIDENHS